MDKSGHKKSLLRKMLEGKQKKKSLSALMVYYLVA